MTRHWTEDDCIDRIYGIGPADDHLGECARCRDLWQRFEARRAALRVEMEQSDVRVRVPAFDIASAPRGRTRLKLAPALVGAGVLAAALLVIHPSIPPRSPVPANSAVVSASDAEFFDEVAALDQSSEPRAVRTAEALFEPTEN